MGKWGRSRFLGLFCCFLWKSNHKWPTRKIDSDPISFSRSGRTTSAGLSAQVMVVRRDRYAEVLITYIRFDSLCHMDTRFELNGITFVWDKGKARSNWSKHGVPFEQAAEAFFDPLAKLINTSTEEEARDALIGLDRQGRLLFVVHIEIKDPIRIISARKAARQERRGYED